MTFNKFEKRNVTLGEIVVDADNNVRLVTDKHVVELKNAMLEYGVVLNGETTIELKNKDVGDEVPLTPATEKGTPVWQTEFARSGGMLKTLAVDGKLHLYSGFHTHTAALELFGEAHSIEVLVNTPILPVTCVKASLLSGSENVHGKNRTREDKNEAVRRWLTDEETWIYTNAFIGRMTNTSGAFVGKVEAKLHAEAKKAGTEYGRPDELIPVDKNGNELPPMNARGAHGNAKDVAKRELKRDKDVAAAAAAEFPNNATKPAPKPAPEATEPKAEVKDEPKATEPAPEATPEDNLREILDALNKLNDNAQVRDVKAYVAAQLTEVVEDGNEPTFDEDADKARDEADDALSTFVEEGIAAG